MKFLDREQESGCRWVIGSEKDETEEEDKQHHREDGRLNKMAP